MEYEKKKCPECGTEFIPVGWNQKWCSSECGVHHSKIETAKRILKESDDVSFNEPKYDIDIVAVPNNGGGLLDWNIPTKIYNVKDGCIEQLKAKLPTEENREVIFSRMPDVETLRKYNDLKQEYETLKSATESLKNSIESNNKKINENIESKRTCKRCGEIKYISEFAPDKNYLGGHRDVCKNCVSIYKKNYNENKHKEKLYLSKDYEKTHTARCSNCHQEKNLTEFNVNRHYKTNFHQKWCRSCTKEIYDLKKIRNQNINSNLIKEKIIINEHIEKPETKISNGLSPDALPVISPTSIDAKSDGIVSPEKRKRFLWR